MVTMDFSNFQLLATDRASTILRTVKGNSVVVVGYRLIGDGILHQIVHNANINALAEHLMQQFAPLGCLLSR